MGRTKPPIVLDLRASCARVQVYRARTGGLGLGLGNAGP
jgi:hypothetical protein